MDGKFGKPKRLKTIVFYPRNDSYFKRSSWVGKLRSPDGAFILDSVANNAAAHFLHNMLFLLGNDIDRSTSLATITAELYRANDIETYDTCAIRAETIDEVEVMFFASHAVHHDLGPRFVYEFETTVLMSFR